MKKDHLPSKICPICKVEHSNEEEFNDHMKKHISEGIAKQLDCSVCNTLLSGKEDVLSYKQNGCCKLCTDVFVYPNRQKWDEGWRPCLDEIASQREKRRAIPSYIL